MFEFLKQKKELAEKEIKLWKREEQLKFEEEKLQDKLAFENSKAEQHTEIGVLTKEKENKRTEINLIDANEKIKNEYLIEKHEAIIAEKNKSIEMLQDTVKVLLAKLPEVNLQNLNIEAKVKKEE